MLTRIMTDHRRRLSYVAALALLAFVPALQATAQEKSGKLAEPITTGQRVFTCGHSFHV